MSKQTFVKKIFLGVDPFVIECQNLERLESGEVPSSILINCEMRFLNALSPLYLCMLVCAVMSDSSQSYGV